MGRQIRLFVGLGNPGRKYASTRHNLGFIVLDEIAMSKNLKFKTWNDVADISFYGDLNNRQWFLKPSTFMNISGVSVSSFAGHYKIKPEEIFVFYDDFSVPLGEYRIRMSGSAGGHNGIKSVIEYLNTDSFPRMKLGLGPRPEFSVMSDFVLSEFTQEDRGKINRLKETAVSFFDGINVLGFDKAVSKLAGKK